MAKVAQNKEGKVTAFSSSFIKSHRKVASSTPFLNAEQAVRKARASLGGSPVPGWEVQLEYLATDSNDLVLVQAVPLLLSSGRTVLAYVNAENGAIVSVINQSYDFTVRTARSS